MDIYTSLKLSQVKKKRYLVAWVFTLPGCFALGYLIMLVANSGYGAVATVFVQLAGWR